MQSVLFQAGLCLLATMAVCGVLWCPRLPWWGVWRTALLMWGLRMAGLILVFGLLDFPFFMDADAYTEQAEFVLGGQVPNRDFTTPYGILSIYLNAGLLWLTGSFWGIVVVLQAAEMAGIALITRALPSGLSLTLRAKFFWLYVFNPISVNSLCLLTQDDCLLILLLGVAAWSVQRSAPRLIGWISVLGFHTTKLFSVWMLFPLVAGLTFRAQLWCGLMMLLSFLGLAVWGIQPVGLSFTRLGGQEDILVEKVTNGNLWFPLSQVWEFPAMLPKVLTLTALAVAAGWIWLRQRQSSSVPSLLWACSLLTLTFQLTYQMSYPMYLAPALPGLIWLCLRHPNRFWIGALLTLSFLSPWLNPAYFRFWRTEGGWAFFRMGYLGLDTLQVICIGVLLAALCLTTRHAVGCDTIYE